MRGAHKRPRVPRTHTRTPVHTKRTQLRYYLRGIRAIAEIKLKPTTFDPWHIFDGRFSRLGSDPGKFKAFPIRLDWTVSNLVIGVQVSLRLIGYADGITQFMYIENELRIKSWSGYKLRVPRFKTKRWVFRSRIRVLFARIDRHNKIQLSPRTIITVYLIVANRIKRPLKILRDSAATIIAR